MPLRAASGRKSLASEVTEQLWAQIDSGEWGVGSRIPTEPELAQTLAVSRNTVREAVRALIHVGVLERRQGSGTYVTARSELAGVVARRLGGAQLHEAVEVRRAFEIVGARLAAHRRTEEDLAAMAAAMAALRSTWSSGSRQEYVAGDAALHVAVMHATHNSVLADLYAEFGAALRSVISAQLGSEPVSESWVVQHELLVDAIRRGDAEAAVEAATGLVEPADPPPPPSGPDGRAGDRPADPPATR